MLDGEALGSPGNPRTDRGREPPSCRNCAPPSGEAQPVLTAPGRCAGGAPVTAAVGRWPPFATVHSCSTSTSCASPRATLRPRRLRKSRSRTGSCEEARRPQRRKRTALPGRRNSHTGQAWAYVEWTWEGLGWVAVGELPEDPSSATEDTCTPEVASTRPFEGAGWDQFGYLGVSYQ